MEESFNEIDKKLVRELYKYAQTWEQLRRVHTQQLEALQHVISDGANETRIFTKPEQQEIAALLKSLEIIGTKIDEELVKETSSLISRVISIFNLSIPTITN